MSKRVIVFTQTHNNKKTLERCVNSVLNQTYKDIFYYIADNASTDGTREMIQHYAEQDSRVMPVFRNDNLIWQIYSCIPVIQEKFNHDDRFIVLDSDDEYVLDAFEKLLFFMEESNLDIATCAYDFIDGVNGKNLNKSNLLSNLVISETDFEARFADYFKFARESHGKMFLLSLFENFKWKSFDNSLLYGSTSIISFEALRNSNKFGVLAERLYKYYIYQHSTERSGSKRLVTPMLYNYYRDWIILKCGHLSEPNRKFLLGAYFRALKNRTLHLLDSIVEPASKLYLLGTVFNDTMTMEMLNYGEIDGVVDQDKTEYIDVVLDWLNLQSFDKGTAESTLSTQIVSMIKKYVGEKKASSAAL